MATTLAQENIWIKKSNYDDAERQHYENLAKLPKAAKGCTKEIDSNPITSSPETPILHLKKVKAVKVVKGVKDYASVLELCDFKEKSTKKSKKSRDANRQGELSLGSVSNKELPPSPPSREGPLLASVPQSAAVAPLAPAVPLTSATPPVLSAEPSTKQNKNKEKLSKAEKKQANKRGKEEASKVEEKQPAVDKISVVKNDHVQGGSTVCVQGSSLASEVAKARQHIKNSLECMDTVLASVPSSEVVNRINSLETALNDLRKLMLGIQSEVKSLAERLPAASGKSGGPAVCPMPAKAAAKAAPKEDSDDGVDLFASDSDGEDDAAAAKIREERLANYAAKKSTKPALIAKSNIILDVKPWDDETDMKKMEENVRTISCDGLLWGASKLVTLAYGIQKLQISCVVEDDKVSIDWLQEEIEKFEDFVQSVDIAAFNKV